MSFVRTVLGDVDSSSIGPCYAHEHLIIDASYTTAISPSFLLDDVDRCAVELTACHAAGVRTMVDSMPMACGRNVTKLAEVARRSGMQIVCPTGLHLQKYYPPGHWSERLGAEVLASLFEHEIDRGIDANDANGPEQVPTSHRAGLIKIAAGLGRINEHERKVFEAASIAHRRTGAPILTHVEEGAGALEQAYLLQSLGVDLRHVALSHLDRNRDAGYHREVLSTGVRVEYDSMFRWKDEQPNPTVALIAALAPEYPDQILLGMDAARRSYWTQYGGSPGMTFLFTSGVDQLRAAGIDAELVHRMFHETPADTFSFKNPRSSNNTASS
jgi:predicted metal-dependent phosphotriesterase family hydrolase